MRTHGKEITIKPNIMVFNLTLACLILFPLSSVFADCPPECSTHQFSIQSMALSYDKVTTALHVEADHHSRNEQGDEVDYVSKMTVSVNGTVVLTRHFLHQRDPDMFYDDVHVKAHAGDVLTVELTSSQENTKSLDMTISDEVLTETQSVDTQSNQTTNEGL